MTIVGDQLSFFRKLLSFNGTSTSDLLSQLFRTFVYAILSLIFGIGIGRALGRKEAARKLNVEKENICVETVPNIPLEEEQQMTHEPSESEPPFTVEGTGILLLPPAFETVYEQNIEDAKAVLLSITGLPGYEESPYSSRPWTLILCGTSCYLWSSRSATDGLLIRGSCFANITASSIMQYIIENDIITGIEAIAHRSEIIKTLHGGSITLRRVCCKSGSFTAADRDFTLITSYTLLSDGTYIIATRSVYVPDLITPNQRKAKNGFIRGIVHGSGYILRPARTEQGEQGCEIFYAAHLDMLGPADGLVNSIKTHELSTAAVDILEKISQGCIAPPTNVRSAAADLSSSSGAAADPAAPSDNNSSEQLKSARAATGSGQQRGLSYKASESSLLGHTLPRTVSGTSMSSDGGSIWKNVSATGTGTGNTAADGGDGSVSVTGTNMVPPESARSAPNLSSLNGGPRLKLTSSQRRSILAASTQSLMDIRQLYKSFTVHKLLKDTSGPLLTRTSRELNLSSGGKGRGFFTESQSDSGSVDDLIEAPRQRSLPNISHHQLQHQDQVEVQAHLQGQSYGQDQDQSLPLTRNSRSISSSSSRPVTPINVIIPPPSPSPNSPSFLSSTNLKQSTKMSERSFRSTGTGTVTSTSSMSASVRTASENVRLTSAAEALLTNGNNGNEEHSSDGQRSRAHSQSQSVSKSSSRHPSVHNFQFSGIGYGGGGGGSGGGGVGGAGGAGAGGGECSSNASMGMSCMNMGITNSNGWETLLQQDDILISELPVGRSPVGILCAHCTIEATPTTVHNVLTHQQAAYNSLISKRHTLKEVNEQTLLQWLAFRAVWPLASSDFIVATTNEVYDANYSCLLPPTTSGDSPSALPNKASTTATAATAAAAAAAAASTATTNANTTYDEGGFVIVTTSVDDICVESDDMSNTIHKVLGPTATAATGTAPVGEAKIGNRDKDNGNSGDFLGFSEEKDGKEKEEKAMVEKEDDDPVRACIRLAGYVAVPNLRGGTELTMFLDVDAFATAPAWILQFLTQFGLCEMMFRIRCIATEGADSWLLSSNPSSSPSSLPPVIDVPSDVKAFLEQEQDSNDKSSNKNNSSNAAQQDSIIQNKRASFYDPFESILTAPATIDTASLLAANGMLPRGAAIPTLPLSGSFSNSGPHTGSNSHTGNIRPSLLTNHSNTHSHSSSSSGAYSSRNNSTSGANTAAATRQNSATATPRSPLAPLPLPVMIESYFEDNADPYSPEKPRNRRQSTIFTPRTTTAAANESTAAATAATACATACASAAATAAAAAALSAADEEAKAKLNICRPILLDKPGEFLIQGKELAERSFLKMKTYLGLIKQPPGDAPLGLDWQLKINKKNMTVESTLVNESAWQAVRAVTCIKASKDKIRMLVTDDSRMKEFDDMFDFAKPLVTVDQTTNIRRLCFKGIWPTLPRDFLVCTSWKELEDGSILVCSISAPDILCCPEKSYVRGCIQISGYWLQPVETLPANDPIRIEYYSYHNASSSGSKSAASSTKGSGTGTGTSGATGSDGATSYACKVTLTAHTELGGTLPASIINMLSTAAPVKMLTAIGDIVCK